MNKQQGFVQGALLIGIALLAIVIGAFAMASNNNTSDVSKEKTKTSAAVAVKKMADTYEMYQIKAAQEDIGAADTAVTNATIAMPVEFTNKNYVLDPTAGSGYAQARLEFDVANATACAAINRVLGLTTSTDDAEAANITDGDEHCQGGTAGYGGFSGKYSRVFRKA